VRVGIHRLSATARTIAGADTMSLVPPRPRIVPPSNGTSGSAVPWTSRTATARDGLQETPVPSVPETGATAANTSTRSQPYRLDMKPPFDIPVAKTCPGAMPYWFSSLPASAARNPRSSTPRRSGSDAPRPSAQLWSMPSG
jgi:hypothetical protein